MLKLQIRITFVLRKSCGYFAANSILPLEAIWLSDICDWSVLIMYETHDLVIFDWSIFVAH